jgi:flagellar biosynthesis/type III secretory pathway protein FliH
VETSAGRVDARLEVQIAALERALAGGGERG